MTWMVLSAFVVLICSDLHRSHDPEAGAIESLLNPPASLRDVPQRGLRMGPIVPDPGRAPGPDLGPGPIPAGAQGGATPVHARALVHAPTLAAATRAVDPPAMSIAATEATATLQCPAADGMSAIGQIQTLTAAWVCLA